NSLPDVKRVLVICPASLRLNWQRELRRWLTRRLSIAVINGVKPADWSPADITIVNYDVVAKHRARIDKHGPYDLLILDESHLLKNSTAIRTKAIYGYSRRGEDTVTPINAR